MRRKLKRSASSRSSNDLPIPRQQSVTATYDSLSFKAALGILTRSIDEDFTVETDSIHKLVMAADVIARNCYRGNPDHRKFQKEVVAVDNIIPSVFTSYERFLEKNIFNAVGAVLKLLAVVMYRHEEACTIMGSDARFVEGLVCLFKHQNHKTRPLHTVAWQLLASVTESSDAPLFNIVHSELCTFAVQALNAKTSKARLRREVLNLLCNLTDNSQLRRSGDLLQFKQVLIDEMNNASANAGAISATIAVAFLAGSDREDDGTNGDEPEIRLDLVKKLTTAYRSALNETKDLGSGKCWELCQLTRGVGCLALHDANKQSLADAGMVDLLLRALEKSLKTDDVALQDETSAAIWMLSFNKLAASTMNTDFGLRVIGRAQAEASSVVGKKNVAGVLFVLTQASRLRQNQQTEGRLPHRRKSLPAHTRPNHARSRSVTGNGEIGKEDPGQNRREEDVANDINIVEETIKPHQERHLKRSQSTTLPRTKHKLAVDTPNDVEENLQHVMLSYCWANQPVVLKLKEALERRGYRIWMDVEQMSGSTLEAMARAVEQSCLVIICVSEAYHESQACRTEAEYVYALKKSFIPCKMSDYAPDGWLGAMLGSRLWFPFYNQPFQNAFDAVYKEILNNGIFPTTKKDVDSITSAKNSSKVVNVPETSTSPKEVSPDKSGDSVDEVENDSWIDCWLANGNLLSYVSTMKEHNMLAPQQFLTLRQFSPELALRLLREDLGITKLGDRLILWQMIQDME